MEAEVVFLFNGFLSHLRFPLLPFAARVMVFKLPLRASASHFRFLEACSELPGVGVRVCGVSSSMFE